ncbi:hypothetical protein Tco_1326893 [Tanacetum coccineum]
MIIETSQKRYMKHIMHIKPLRRDKEVNMAAGDYDDALVCCVENTINDHIMEYGASFHATYCKEELERFKLRSGKVHLPDDKTQDIAGVGDVVLKTSFSTSWTLKDVRVGLLTLPTHISQFPASRLIPAAGKENAAELTLSE